MRKTLIILFAFVFIAIIVGTLMSNIQNENFNFSLRYSVDGKDFISTFDNTLKVDTIGGEKVVEFQLKEKDLQSIQDKIKELGIMELDFQKMPNSGVIFSNMGICEYRQEKHS